MTDLCTDHVKLGYPTCCDGSRNTPWACVHVSKADAANKMYSKMPPPDSVMPWRCSPARNVVLFGTLSPVSTGLVPRRCTRRSASRPRVLLYSDSSGSSSTRSRMRARAAATLLQRRAQVLSAGHLTMHAARCCIPYRCHALVPNLRGYWRSERTISGHEARRA
ncbi:hypothetical protein OH77DRAFT_342472 [Trametes cingulata]|nr:hypothetical protein OH77DRAFT_342472 [Trametes cingulata]